jgi:hypothetical protein
VLEREVFEYALIRVMPRIERAEFVNAGVILICRAKRFLDCRIALNRARVLAIAPNLTADDLDEIERQLSIIPRICKGDRTTGPIAALNFGQRWHWLTAPANTVVQPGPVHTGLTADPAATLERLFQTLVVD